jgi:uncharacterized phage protein gp47/JayE
MAFQIKDFVSIAASIMNYAKAVQASITDFSVGSVARTILEAPAVEIEELYQQMWIGLKESIPVSVYNSFDFERIAAKPATGAVRVSISPQSADVVITSGTRLAMTGTSLQFVSTIDAVIPAGGSYVDVYVAAQTTGASGNIPATTPFTLAPAPTGFASAVALADFANGTDVETDDQRKARFISYVRSLNRGTTDSLKYGLSLVSVTDALGNVTESVRFKSVIEPYKTDPLAPISLVNCYIHNGATGASSALVGNSLRTLEGYVDSSGNRVPGWKAAGVHVTVQAASNVAVNIAGVLTVDPTCIKEAVQSRVGAAIADYINGLDVGQGALVAEIITSAMNIAGVINFIPSSPTTDVVILPTEKAILGTLTVTA